MAHWSLILHGGAKTIAPGEEEANRAGLLQALDAGAAVLEAGGAALDAVEAAIRVLEDLPVFNAGHGSVRNTDGEVEMDAAIMDGATLALGGVAALRGVRNPIEVARLMLQEKPTLLVGEGARRFAEAHSAALCPPTELIAAAPGVGDGHDTVGCVAFDARGHLAAGTSTGGLEGQHPGRVGDSPLPGCGLYADDHLGATCFSGEGESISRVLLAGRVMVALGHLEPQAAMEEALRAIDRVGGEAGGIVIDPSGRLGWAHNSSHFAVGVATAGQVPRAFLSRAEMTAHG
jgi:beta-aspartyl-peptidase (threonine type)